MTARFEPNDRDRDGLHAMLGRIDRERPAAVKLNCFSEPEARWLRAEIERLRPRLKGRVGLTWLKFHRSTSQDQLRNQLLDLILGKDGVLWQNRPDDPRTFEVRRDGKHVGFISVLESGEVVWL